MKYVAFVPADIWRKPTGTVFPFLSVAVAFTMFCIPAGLTDYIARALESSRLEWLFVNPRFGSLLPLTYQTKITAVSGVILAVTPGLVADGVIFACVLDFVGGVFPAAKAARRAVVDALKAR